MNIKIWPEWNIVGMFGREAFGSIYIIRRGGDKNAETAVLKEICIYLDAENKNHIQKDGILIQGANVFLPACVDDVIEEIKLMQQLSRCSNIIAYEDYLIRKHDQGSGWDIYIRMELIDTLENHLHSQPLSEKEILKLGLDISRALIDFHNEGILHRNIKPWNIFIDKQGGFKLGDFGIPRKLSDDGLKGFDSNMAPQNYYTHNPDACLDIYSLALVMYRLLNRGQDPFLPVSGLTPAQWDDARRRRIGGEPLPRPAHGSDSLCGVLAIALAPIAENCYQTAGQFHDALKKQL